MAKTLTPQDCAQHIRTHGVRCPFCNESDPYSLLPPETFDDGAIRWKISCPDCGETYYEVYTLAGIDTLGGAGYVGEAPGILAAILDAHPILVNVSGGVVQDVALPYPLAAILPILIVDHDVDAADTDTVQYCSVTRGVARAAIAHCYSPHSWDYENGFSSVDGEMPDVWLAYLAWKTPTATNGPAPTAPTSCQASAFAPGGPEEGPDDCE